MIDESGHRADSGYGIHLASDGGCGYGSCDAQKGCGGFGRG